MHLRRNRVPERGLALLVVATERVWLLPNAGFLILVLVLAALAIAPIWAFFSAVVAPGLAWARTEKSKTLWVISLPLSFILLWPLSVVLGFVYLLRVRPKLRNS